MTLVELDASVWVDEESGEILDIPAGTDRCLLLARKLDEANTQIKAWERLAAVAKAGLIRYQEDRRAEYDGLVVRIQQNQRADVDAARLAVLLWLGDVPADVLLGIVASSKVPVASVPGPVVTACVQHSLTRPFVIAERARKRAPGTD